MDYIKDKLKGLPAAPGVYVMKDSGGAIIYIGKAKSLKSRVSSYFMGAHDSKVTAMIAHISDFEYFVVNSEDDALFLEASLVYKHQPHYNILLKDGRKFPYIRIGGGVIEVVRDTKGEGQHFGPYFNGIYVHSLIDIIRNVYGDDPVKAAEFLSGKRYAEVMDVFTNRMEKAAEMRQFELAIAYRNVLRSVSRMQSRSRVAATAEDADAFTLGACRELGEVLGMKKTPRKIECFDISHTAGENQVASMTVFIDGAADKRLYRKFKIRHGQGNNDFLSMAEVLTRRIAYLLPPKSRSTHDGSFSVPPDLIVIDGGKGQLSAVLEAVGAVAEKLDIAFISLAERFEFIYTTKNGEPLLLPKRSYALRLLERIRDEAHRFAITFHRKLRGRDLLRIKN